MIKGNIEGLRDSILNELKLIYQMSVDKNRVVSREIVEFISSVTRVIKREICVAIDRKGRVLEVAVGDSNSVDLPLLELSSRRLSGVKIIHTHPNGYPKLSSLDISALIKLKLDCMVAIGVGEEGILGLNLGICKIEDNEFKYEEFENLTVNQIEEFNYLEKVESIEKDLKKVNIVESDSELAILVGVDSMESLDELSELARACDVKVVGKIFQKIKKIDNIFYIGSGKVRELCLERQIKKANLIIFDEELSGVQIKNLEAVTGCKVIDRTILILEIFARRAKTREAKIQVELAQLKYRSQRLIGLGTIMSRTGGGIGTKGPGEKKLEIDRRRIKDEIHNLKQELEKIQKNRALQRNKREQASVSRISLVGYTNVGKSTLRNLLVERCPSNNSVKKEAVFAENMLFATLDATTRTIVLPDKRVAALTDTVGFVRKLPHDLVEAFKSTLEEVIFSELLLHVVDSASETVLQQIEAVDKVLEELGARDRPIILVLNKSDIASEENILKIKERIKEMEIVEISAKTEKNIDLLLEKICSTLPLKNRRVELQIPYSETSITAHLHRNAIVESEEYKNEFIKVVAVVTEEIYNRYKKYIPEN